MTRTQTRSLTNTHTKTRARELMKRRIDPDIQQLATRGFITRDQASTWIRDLRYLAEENAVASFDMIFTHTGKRMGGYRYAFIGNGTVTSGELSGGMNLWGLPDKVSVHLVVDLRPGAFGTVWKYLKSRGWGTNGVPLAGSGTRDRTFSYQGFGAIRKVFGDLP